MLKALAVATALVATLGSVGSSCGSRPEQSPATQPRNDRRDRPSPPDCPPDFTLRRISNREFRCIVSGTPSIPVSARCPLGWEVRGVEDQRVTPPDRRPFTTAVRWRCLNT